MYEFRSSFPRNDIYLIRNINKHRTSKQDSVLRNTSAVDSVLSYSNYNACRARKHVSFIFLEL